MEEQEQEEEQKEKPALICPRSNMSSKSSMRRRIRTGCRSSRNSWASSRFSSKNSKSSRNSRSRNSSL